MIKIGGSCSWKAPGETTKHTIGNDIIEVRYNDSSYDCSYFIDIETPRSQNSNKVSADKRVYVTTEPASFKCYTSRFDSTEISNHYKGMILSWHPAFKDLPQTKIFQPAAKWVGPLNNAKSFGISGLFSQKNEPGFDGYKLRHEILDRDSEIKVPGTIFNYRKHWKDIPHNYPLESKLSSMHFMFHLSIENCSEVHYFTEKLIDPIACRVIPLYFGDPMIDDVFDMNGIIKLDTKFYIDQINSLTEEDYTSRASAIENNFEKSKKYWHMDERIISDIYSGLIINDKR